MKSSRKLPVVFADEEGCDVVYSDGACKGNGHVGCVAGIGVWWGHDDPRNIAERCPGSQTNNRAELIAIVRVLEETPVSERTLVIKTDSTYSIKCITEWMPNWQRRGWKTAQGKPILNLGILRYLSALRALRQVYGQDVRFVYVRGHAGIVGNEGADGLANTGVLLPEVDERNWDAERRRIVRLMEQLKEELEAEDEDPESVQVSFATDEDEDEYFREASELDIDDLDTSRLNGSSASMHVTSPFKAKSKTNSSATSTKKTSAPASVFKTSTRPPSASEPGYYDKYDLDEFMDPTPVATTSTSTTAHASKSKDVIRPPPAPASEYTGFGFNDILDPDELAAELAEAQGR
ncbi:hypothetical protein EW145_g2335 [Phellinidium pouzarii]|uniref:ribonuclease H n=1 Tax=Phellinidium pouzarii TaxID=167371 RepID=A0A4S4LBA5_9AGAM|nr:hypothetical protein EW145_g2335 [Phellinidium pouzarii]